ncbi:MAG: zinc ribbon domain-containing protein [Methanomassiliicoccales archaeon]|nr:MAG: zinc ribbon domain-containing protein [Methanomassiliicoccales archaeon]
MSREMEAYLSNVKFWMLSIPSKARKGIIEELRNHIIETAYAMGGLGMIGQVIAGMDSPRKTAKRYREIYGYNMIFKVLFVLICIFLAIWTVPIWEIVNPAFSTTFVFLILIVFLFIVGSRAGKMMALTMGISALVTRFIILGLIVALAGEHGIIQGGGVILFLLSSLLLIVIAYLPAKVIEKWQDRRYWPPPIPQSYETRSCPRCGIHIPIQSKFCNECGNRV